MSNLADTNPWKPIADWQEQESKDAARWRYVRDNLMRSDPKMDGTSYWFFRNPLGRGISPDDVIDQKITESRQQRGHGENHGQDDKAQQSS